MEIIWFIVVGFIAGLVARAIMPGSDPMGWILTTVLGIAGALIAGFLGRALGWYDSATTGPGIIAAIVGAVILLAIGRLVSRGGSHRRPSV